MKSITLSSGDIYFESIIKDLRKISPIKKKKGNDIWYFSVFGKIEEIYYYPSEEQAKKDYEKLLLFLSQCEIEATNESAPSRTVEYSDEQMYSAIGTDPREDS